MKKVSLSPYSLDARSVGLFRITTAWLLLADLAARFSDRFIFYGQKGLLPTSLLDQLLPFRRASLLFIPGADGFLTIFFVVSMAVALLLLVGWRTREAAIFSWVAVLSLHARDPFILNGG